MHSCDILLWDHLFIVCITLLFYLRLLWSWTGSRSLLLLDATDNIIDPQEHAGSLNSCLECLRLDTVRVPDLKRIDNEVSRWMQTRKSTSTRGGERPSALSYPQYHHCFHQCQPKHFHHLHAAIIWHVSEQIQDKAQETVKQYIIQLKNIMIYMLGTKLKTTCWINEESDFTFPWSCVIVLITFRPQFCKRVLGIASNANAAAS